MKHFFYDGRDLSLALETSYNTGLVILSIAIAVLSSYAALSVAGRMKATESGTGRKFWLLSGALSMGGGVWAMHFIAMLALKLPMEVSYDMLITAVSTLPSILAAAVMVYAISRPRTYKMTVAFSGSMMGIGIGAMHYIGMTGMEGKSRELIMLYEPRLMLLSLIVALILPTVALSVNLQVGRNQNDSSLTWAKVGAALIMGFAVSGMHFTGMAGTYFFPGAEAAAFGGQSTLDPLSLVFWVSFTSVLIASLAIFITVVDSRIQQATHDEALSRYRMREAIESIPDGFSLYDMEDRLVECNQRYREIMNFGVPIVPGMTFETIMRGAARSGLIVDAMDRCDEWLVERMARHRSPRESFIEHFKGDRWMRVSERRVWNTGTVAIRTDITELKQTEIELSKAMEEAQKARAIAEEASNAKSIFLANMSHELRTPMNAIIGYSEMILEEVKAEGEDSVMVNDLVKIRSSAVHLLSLINEILDLSKIEAGRMELCLEEIHLPSILNEVINTVKPIVDKNQNLLSVDHSEVPEIMMADATKLQQILLNLLSNAGKFTHCGRINFIVARQYSENRDWLLFRVEDTGIGMSKDQVDKVFDAFTQADNSTTRKYGGTGLGLTITKKYCEMMGGTIDVDSRVSAGSTFLVRLPFNIPS